MRYGIWRNLPRYSGGVRKWDIGRAVAPRAVFVHIMEGHLAGTDGWFRNPASGTVSTHFGIGYANAVDRLVRRVSVYQWVDTTNTAWGTAVTRYPVSRLAQNVLGDLIRGGIDVNHGIIHIEVEGYPDKRWPAGFVTALNALLAALGRAHGPLTVMRHNDVSSKVCPGTATPWSLISPSYGQRLSGTPVPLQPLPDTAQPKPKPKERDVYEWVARMKHQTPKVAVVRKGAVLLKNPDGTQHYTLPEDTRIEVLGGLPGWFWAGRRTGGDGLFLIRNSDVRRWL